MGMDVFGIAPQDEAGEYFRANVWSWRPIYCLMLEANERHGLELDLTGFDTNSGDGLANQADCDRLADALEAILAENPTPVFRLDSEPTGVEAALLGQLHAAGWQVMSPSNRTGLDYPSHYAAGREHVEEFIGFLRACGGFRIC